MNVLNLIYKKKDNETDFEYGLRLIEIKCEDNPQDLDWQDICDLLKLTIHKDSLRKAGSTTPFSAYKVMKYFQDKIKENITDDEQIIKLDEKIKELQKEKIKFQDQKREYRNYLRADARFDNLRNELNKSVKELKNYKPLNNYCDMYLNKEKDAVLILSDLHIGLETKNYWNVFNLKIAKQRLSELKDKVIYYCKLNRVSNLRIELLGDLINGYIHLGTRVSNEEDVISQTMITSEILADFINQIAKEIPNIFIYSATGNHARCIPSLKDSIDVENFEKLIPWYLKSRIDCKNVKIIDNEIDDNIIVYKFRNEIIFAVHGHCDKVNTVINDLSGMIKKFPTEIHMGHYHRHSVIEDNNIEVIINSSFSGTDDFAKNKIRKVNKPSQTLIIYNDDGQECMYKIKL